VGKNLLILFALKASTIFHQLDLFKIASDKQDIHQEKATA